MADKHLQPDLTPPSADEVVLPLPREMTPGRWGLRVLSWTAVLAGLFLLLRFDLSLMQWKVNVVGKPDGLFDQVLGNLRDFAEAFPILVILIVVATYDRRRWFVIGTVLFAQLLAAGPYNLGKQTIIRYRPDAAMEQFGDISEITMDQVWGGFTWGNPEVGHQSFPSGHSAAAFALAGVLVWFYPRLAWLFWILAAGCAASRFFDAVHWASDCLAGAAIGYVAAWLALRPYAWALPVIWYRRGVKRRQAAVRAAKQRRPSG